MGRQTITREYFSWLYKRIGNQRRTYYKLCWELNKKKFRWFIPNDDNRFEDGLNLRETFISDNNLDESHLEVKHFLKGDCTIFEMMVALSERINDLMYDLRKQEDHTSKWFFEMISNLDLAEFNDASTIDDRFDPISEARIDEILENLIDRTYASDGRGSLFPLKKRHPKDMSTVEIWYQLMAYMDENYGQ